MSLDVYLTIDAGGPDPVELFSANYTHNCNKMADVAGLYGIVWRPEENCIVTASDLISPLETGIAAMEADPEKFRALNPDNGWGSYDTFIPWLRRYLDACRKFPRANVRACR